MAHLLEHLVFKGTPTIANIFQELGRAACASTARPLRPHQLLRDRSPPTTRTSTGRWRWRPTGWSTRFVAQGGPRHRDDGGAQRVRDWREQPAPRALEAAAGAAYDWHNYGNLHHRRALRHRERRHRAAAGVLPHLLPAGQRGADRRRQVRPGEDARAASRSHFGPIPKPTRALPTLYTARAGAGRRALGHRAPRRRRAVRRRALPHAAGLAPRLRRARRAGRDHDHRARRAGCTRRWSRPRKRAPSRRWIARRCTIRARSSSGRRCRRASRSTPPAARCSPRSTASRDEPITAGRGRPRAHPRADQAFDETHQRSAAARASRCPSRSRWATGGSSSCSATAGAR